MVRAVKAKRGSKSQAIRSYLSDNPKARVQEVVDALKQRGVEVSAALVNNIKYTKKKRGRKKSKKTAESPVSPSRAGGEGRSDDSVSLQALIEVKKTADRLGGVYELQRAAAALARLQQ